MSDPGAKKIMIVGGADSGKTTTLQSMLVQRQDATALVDLDLGQSHVGPPAMLAWGFWRQGYRELEDISPERIFFVGATSPLANPAAAISGAAAVCSDAEDHSDKVLIDTSGAIMGRFARRLKLEKIRAVRPDFIIGLERETELEHILSQVEGERLARVIRGSVPRGVSGKSPKERSSYRQARFAAYFGDARDLRLALNDIEVMRFGQGGEVDDEFEGLVEGMLVGLADRVGRHQGMGILRVIDRQQRELGVLGRIPPGARIAALIPGRMCVTEDGTEQPLSP